MSSKVDVPSSFEILTDRHRASTTASVLQTLDAKITALSDEAATQKVLNAEYDRALQTTLKEVMEKSKEKGGLGARRFGAGGFGANFGGDRGVEKGDRERGDGGRENMGMDVDEPQEGGGPRGGKNRKYGRIFRG